MLSQSDTITEAYWPEWAPCESDTVIGTISRLREKVIKSGMDSDSGKATLSGLHFPMGRRSESVCSSGCLRIRFPLELPC